MGGTSSKASGSKTNDATVDRSSGSESGKQSGRESALEKVEMRAIGLSPPEIVPIQMGCGNCKFVMALLPETKVGSNVVCPNCQTVVTVPAQTFAPPAPLTPRIAPNANQWAKWNVGVDGRQSVNEKKASFSCGFFYRLQYFLIRPWFDVGTDVYAIYTLGRLDSCSQQILKVRDKMTLFWICILLLIVSTVVGIVHVSTEFKDLWKTEAPNCKKKLLGFIHQRSKDLRSTKPNPAKRNRFLKVIFEDVIQMVVLLKLGWEGGGLGIFLLFKSMLTLTMLTRVTAMEIYSRCCTCIHGKSASTHCYVRCCVRLFLVVGILIGVLFVAAIAKSLTREASYLEGNVRFVVKPKGYPSPLSQTLEIYAGFADSEIKTNTYFLRNGTYRTLSSGGAEVTLVDLDVRPFQLGFHLQMSQFQVSAGRVGQLETILRSPPPISATVCSMTFRWRTEKGTCAEGCTLDADGSGLVLDDGEIFWVEEDCPKRGCEDDCPKVHFEAPLQANRIGVCIRAAESLYFWSDYAYTE